MKFPTTRNMILKSLLFDRAITCTFAIPCLGFMFMIPLRYMLPNTPHFVFGMENSICYGGHFYSTMTMQRTLSGLIHSFMLDKFVTNTAHQASRQLLRRILVLYLHGLMDKKISTEGMKLILLTSFNKHLTAQIVHGHTFLTWKELMA